MNASSLSRMTLVALVATLTASALGCAFFTKSKPVVLRYFTPEATSTPPQPAGVAMPMRPEGLDLRLGRVNAASYLKDRIAFRDGSFEIGYYEDFRWTEKPEAYLRRALGRALFEEQGVHQVISGVGTTLDVDLDAFEEVRSPRHVARIQVTWALRDDERVQLQETFAIERPIPSTEPGAPGELAAAMAAAFDESVRHIVVRVMAALASDGARGRRSECGASGSP
jgi:cholesterol transport system auxiliary component